MEIKDIVSMYQSYKAAKSKREKDYKFTRSLYNGEFWEKYKEKIKDYTLTPDTNYIEYVVSAYVNSIYSSEYRPEVTATDLEKVDMSDQLNAYIETSWRNMGMKLNFSLWGENTVLYNMQPVKVYLDKEKDEIKFENINPFDIYFDPAVSDFKEGGAVFIVKEVNIYNLLKDPRFKTKTLEYITKNERKIFEAREIGRDYERFTTTGNKIVSLIEYYIRKENGIENGFIINEEEVVYKIEKIKPDVFPIEVLYFRNPTEDPYGRSLISKIRNSYIALNLLDSIDATHPYLMQNRPRFFNLESRINPRSFKDYGNNPNATFPLIGDPSKAIHYADLKALPDSTNIKNRLELGIFNITGVDPAYKGRQTNSIITTGGVQQQQARVIMLTDNAPLVALESFVERLTKLWIDFHIEYITKGKKINKAIIEVDESGNRIAKQAKITFKDIEENGYSYTLESMSYVPMTKETLFEKMMQLYQYQGQYQFSIPLITEEDLLEELPVSPVKKAKMMQRISSEKQATGAAKRRETLMTFAALFQQFKEGGLSDEEAAEEALETMDQEAMMMSNDPSLGNNPEGMPPMGGMPMGM